MRVLVIAAAAFMAACTPPQPVSQEEAIVTGAAEDAAGNRIEPLAAQGVVYCSEDRIWCVEKADTMLVRRDGAQVASIPLENAEASGVWPSIIRSGDTALVGVTRSRDAMYSGGGGSATMLTLYDVSGAAPAAVLELPLSGAILIRACFNEADRERRAGACHDEYNFDGLISLDPSVESGAPRIVLTTEATTHPGQRNRSSDSSEGPALQQNDLVQWSDPTCSYRRVARREGDAYVWDDPLPACGDYLEP